MYDRGELGGGLHRWGRFSILHDLVGKKNGSWAEWLIRWERGRGCWIGHAGSVLHEMSPGWIGIRCHGLERFGAIPTDSSVGGYWDCYLVTVILVVWFVYLKIMKYHARCKAALPILDHLGYDLESNVAQLTIKELEILLKWKGVAVWKIGEHGKQRWSGVLTICWGRCRGGGEHPDPMDRD